MPKKNNFFTKIPDFVEMRKMAGVSQEEVAWNVGMDQSQLSKIERNIVSPTQGMVKRLLDFYRSKGVVPLDS